MALKITKMWLHLMTKLTQVGIVMR